MATTKQSEQLARPGTQGQSLGYMSPKPWKDLKTDEKIERMRELLKSTYASIDRLNGEIANLWEHSHEEDGKVVIRISKNDRHRLQNYGGMLSAKSSSEEYI